MTKKLYRTARGATVDMEELRAHNENRVASGNMQVNARGDALGPGGTVSQSVAQLAREAQVKSKKSTVTASVRPALQPTESSTAEADPAPAVSDTPVEHMDADGNITVTSPSAKQKPKKAKAKVSEVSNEDSSTE